MYKKFLIIIGLFFSVQSFSQNLSIDWSEKFNYEKETGFLDTIFGENENSLFVKFYSFRTNPLILNGPKSNIKIQLATIDKKTKKKTSTLNLIGYKENDSQESKYKDIEFYKVVMTKNVIYVLWVNKFDFYNVNYSLYAQTFDLNFKPLQPLKKIIDLKITKDFIKRPVFFATTIPENDNIFVGSELNGKENENLKIDVRLLKPNLTLSTTKIIEFPSELTKDYDINHLLANYSGIKGEKLVIETMYNTGVFNFSNNSSIILPADFENKVVQSSKFYIENNTLKFFGTFSEKFTEILSEKKPGIFTFDLDLITMKISNSQFIYFTNEQVNLLFSKLNKDLPDTYASDPLFDRRKMYYTLDELIIEKGSFFMFLSKSLFFKTNYDYVFSYKETIAPMRLTNDGKISIFNLIQRNEFYNGDIIPKDDVSTLKDENNYYVFFGWQPKNEKKTFSIDLLSDDYVNYASKFQYYITDIKTGISTFKSFNVFNKANKSDIKYISYDGAKLIGDNSYYFISVEEPNIMGNSNKKSKQIGKLQISK